ncbi:uncharacterized protein LOC110975550 [Acanthaster planci]|uniref:Uncharacterized protein LOC110975550 n=1 Tax=Acanthaster planci TaxID=133434 RepID=A0A8B7XSI3_ACAPL|nr:uncharacterized protein LOC110975550 [Acanthaster planci]
MDEMICYAKRDIESFIRTGPLNDGRPGRTVLLFNGRVYCSTPYKHAEQIAFDSIGYDIYEIKNIDMCINYSPCHNCAARILHVVQNHCDVKIQIKFAKVFQIKEPENKQGLKELKMHGVTLKAMEGQDWKFIVGKILEHHWRLYWKTLLQRTLDEHWQLGQESVQQEILMYYKKIYRTAKMMCIFIKHWETELETEFSRLSLSNREGRRESDLQLIIRENWSKGRWVVLAEILKYQGMDNWETVLMEIFKQEDNYGWRTALKHIVSNQHISDTHHQYLELHNCEDVEYVEYQLLQAWENSTWILYHHWRDGAKDRLTRILQNNGKTNLVELVQGISDDNRQGYAWLKLVLKALRIENRVEWSGQRIIADYHAARKLKQSYL